ncbi:6540_t:CDS:2, partial [Funneliformis geosporum]
PNTGGGLSAITITPGIKLGQLLYLPYNPIIKPLTLIPKSTTKIMDKDQLKALIDSITKGFKDVTKDLKNVNSSSS